MDGGERTIFSSPRPYRALRGMLTHPLGPSGRKRQMHTEVTKAGKVIHVLDLEECRQLAQNQKFPSAKGLNEYLKAQAKIRGAYAPYVNLDLGWSWGVVETDTGGATPAQAASRVGWAARMTELRAAKRAERVAAGQDPFTPAQRAAQVRWAEACAKGREKKKLAR